MGNGDKHGTCAVPCEALDVRLKEIWSCLRDKVTSKVFFMLIIPLFGFVVVVIGGAQWAIYEKVNEIKTEMAIHTQQMIYAQGLLNSHIEIDAERHKEINREMEKYHPWRK